MAGSPNDGIQGGGGFNFLCMHPEPQHPTAYNDGQQEESNTLHVTQYFSPSGISIGDAACAVCMDNNVTAVYVQWGRTQCSDGHTTQYSGTIMASLYTAYKSENLCVDSQTARSDNNETLKISASGLFRTIMEGGASDEQQYKWRRELSCAVCSPVDRARVFTHWGSRTCPVSRNFRKLYDGFMAGSRASLTRGGGANFLCMHPSPVHTVSFPNDNDHDSLNKLTGTEYAENKMPSMDKNVYGDAACVVCEYVDTPALYVQWGRVSCSNGHTTQYTGLVMSTKYSLFKSEHVCVDVERGVHETSSEAIGASSRLFVAEMRVGAMDELKYPDRREVACAVCSPNATTSRE